CSPYTTLFRSADFVKCLSVRTRDKMGVVVPVEISIFKDRSFEFVLKNPPASVLIKTELKLQSGSKTPGRESAGKITQAQLEKIAKDKMSDLNAGSLEAAKRLIAGTARSMGIQLAD